ncbi:hypothetical protein ACFFX1_22135 [Dactylosporangium sucinum]|uniref:VOC domain-containing protein n=1 Tax=Dactylosporangium sucinum TaxID=1424081 RepID=A0A917X098_9ACTN|nr:hypothetical protein [Dactylosporangium sucinum]GGM45873.1 hypothetical protein GCM10007977_054500 [Dactylosporangium sucinum]
MPLGRVLEAVVACRDVQASVDFHTTAFDLDVIERTSDNALLGVAGVATGRLRLVPAPAAARVLPDPQVWDIGPRLLGMYSRDLAASIRGIDDAGGRARPSVTYPYGSAHLTECVALGTDGVWWTMPQAGAAHRPSPALERDPQRRHGELHTAVIVPADHDAAVDFFVRAGGLSVLFEGEMSGDPFDRMVGMPAEASLRLTFLVPKDQAPARLEIMSFRGVSAADESQRQLGLRRLIFAADDVEATRAALLGAGATAVDATWLRGPAGLEIALRPDEAATTASAA